jgi:hypothetical protein
MTENKIKFFKQKLKFLTIFPVTELHRSMQRKKSPDAIDKQTCLESEVQITFVTLPEIAIIPTDFHQELNILVGRHMYVQLQNPISAKPPISSEYWEMLVNSLNPGSKETLIIAM